MDTENFTSGDIASAVKETASAAPASPAAHTQTTENKADPTTTASAAASGTAAAEDQHGPVPFERHEAILGKTRREYDERLGRLSWAERLDAQRVERALALQELYESAPDGLYEALGKRLKPVSEAPQPDLRSEDGTPLYSAAQASALAKWEAKQMADALRREFGERVEPIETDRAQTKKIEDLSQQIVQASAWPGFTAHVDLITAAIAAANGRGEVLPLKDAYIAIVAPKLAASRETLEPEIRKAVLDELNKTTARAKDDLNPSRIPAGSRKADKDKSFKELVTESAQELTGRKAS